MSSILTNTSSMVALQTLRGISSDLAKTQDMISTGKRIATAKDNAAIWSISKVMESDVKGFKAITDSLNLGLSTTAVARNAAESVKEMLTEVKTRIIAAQEENVDRNKLQAELVSLRGQIASIVSSAQFNGLNMLSNRENVEGSGEVNVLASLNRSSDGTLSSEQISVAKQDLGTQAKVFGGTAVGAANDLLSVSGASVAAAGGTATVSFTADGAEAGASYRVTLTGVAGNELGTTAINFDYVARDGDTELDVSEKIFDQINNYITANELENTSIARNATTGQLTITNDDATAANTITLARTENLGGTAGGGLEQLASLDISTSTGASAALVEIEGLIQTSIDAAAEFGTAEKRVEIQSEFTSRLIDSLKAGIGALVDTDMEAASAQLQALQVQQQLGVQALSIANQAPQTILSLFQ